MVIEDIDARLLKLEEHLAAAAAGDVRPIEITRDDPLAAIEVGVNVVLHDLVEEIARAQTARDELQVKLEELTAQAELIRRQRETILQLSTPLLQLWDEILALPIIGSLDDTRAESLSKRMLDEVHASKVRFVILDLTGIEIVDTHTAGRLMQVIQAARLLGVECLLSGIQPEVALTLAHLQEGLAGVQTHRNLKQSLAACLKIMAKEQGRA
nr:STAS domain-containing protein [Pseudenhygromyxa sp. WMMC2535]